MVGAHGSESPTRCRPGWLVALALASTLSGITAGARAYHDEQTEIVVETAHVLSAGEVRLGLWRLDVGIADAVDVGTYTWLWLVPFPNAQVKWRIYRDERWGLAVRTGAYYLDSSLLWWTDVDSDFSAGIVPLELWFTAPIAEDWALTLGSAWTTVFLTGTYDPDEFAGTAAVDNLQFQASVEWRVSRVTALLLTMRWLAYERARGDATAVLQLDDFTTVEVAGAASIRGESVRNAAYLMLSTVFSWETVNLRVGVGGGNYNLPSVNLMLPRKSIVAELDLYFRF